MTSSSYKIINSGVVLEFYKAFNNDGKLKKKLFNWYCKTFENTRCEYDKKLSLFKVFYRDEKAIELGKSILRHFASGDGIDLHIYLSGILTSKAEKFIGSEYVCNFDGLTAMIYSEFFKMESRTPLKLAEENLQIKAITDYGKFNRTQIEGILQEWQDPVPPQMFGGATK